MGNVVTDEAGGALTEQATCVAFHALVIEVVRVSLIPSVYGLPAVPAGISNTNGHRAPPWDVPFTIRASSPLNERIKSDLSV